MGVYISNETMNDFHNNGFTDNQIDSAIADYRQKGFSDDEIGNMIKNDFGANGNGTPLLHGSVSNIEELPNNVEVNNKSFVKNPITRMRYGFSNDLDGIANAIYNDYPDVEQVYKDPYREELIAKKGNEYFPVNPQGFDMGDIPGTAIPMIPEIAGGIGGAIGGGVAATPFGATPFGAYAGEVAGTAAGNIAKQNLAGLMRTQRKHDWGETGMSAGVSAALPVIGKAVKPIAKPIGNFVSKMARVPVSAAKRAVEPTSNALDMSADEARNLLTKTTDRIQNDYNDIIDTLGQNVGDAAKNLPKDKTIYAQRIKDSLDNIYDSYQTGDKKEANVAYNEAGKLNNYFKNLIDNSSDAVKLTGKELGDFDNHKDLEDAAINFYRNNFQNGLGSIKKDGITINFTKAGRKETISKARNPEMNDNLKFIPKLDEIIEKGKFHGFQNADKDKYINSKTLFGYIDTPVLLDGEKKIARVTLRKDALGEIYYNINDKIKILDKINVGDDSLTISAGNATVSKSSPKDIITQFDENIKLGAPELHDLLKNINAKVNWNDPKSKIQNEILERFYGATSDELSKMSPELAAANKAFSEAKDFSNKEGLRQILYPADSNKIDAASSILKNYAGFTRGNREQNLVELEKFLTENGKKPFIEVLQDINATQALNQAYTTGDSTLANFVNSFVLEPALRSARSVNRVVAKTPDKIKEPFKKVKYSPIVAATTSQNNKKQREPFVKKQK